MKRLLIALSGLVALALVPLAAGPVQAPRSAALEAALRDVDAKIATDFASDGAGGVSVGVLAGGKLVWTKHYGFADAEAKRVATDDTAYRIGSITKQFTALMLLQLVEKGKMGLTDPLEKYVPEVKGVTGGRPGTPPITLLQVGTMMSGLSREPGCANHSVGPVSGWQQKVLDCLPLTTYEYEPGTQYLYSNIGYATLGLALERAAGQPYTAYVDQHVVKPLGMSRTTYEPTTEIRKDLAHGYARANAQAAPSRTGPDRELDGRGYRVPNGALFSTVNDLAKFAAWELGEGPSGLLKKETQDANYTRVYSGAGPLSSGYGLGFQAQRRGALVFIGHGGSTGGFLSAVFVHRASKAAVIVLHNGDGGTFNPSNEAYAALEKIVGAAGG
jgi:CubicO group peptidase (beta-lactamase class C family)